MQADMAVAHLAFQFGARHQGRDTVHHQHVDGAGAHQRIGDFERLFTGVGLGDQQFVDVDAELAGVAGIESVFRVHEGAGAAGLLGLGDGMEGQRGLARAFRTVDFDDAATRQSADAECDIEAERAGRDNVRIRRGFARAELHDGALAERAFDLTEGRVECLLLIHGTFNQTQGCGRHAGALFSHTPDRSAM